MSVLCLLWFAAFVATVVSATGRLQLWVPVLLVTIAGLVLPLR